MFSAYGLVNKRTRYVYSMFGSHTLYNSELLLPEMVADSAW